MPIINSATATTRADLSSYYSEYSLDAMGEFGYVGYKILPPKSVPKKSGNFLRFPVEWAKQRSNTRARAVGGAYPRMGAQVEQSTYACKDYGVEMTIDDDDVANYSNEFDALAFATRIAAKDVIDAAELRIATALTSGWGGSSAGIGGAAWTTIASAVPVTDIETAVQAVRTASGQIADTIIMSWKAFRYCRLTAQVADRMKYQGFVDVRPDKITTSVLASVFGVKKVLVAGETRNTANQGQTASMSGIWGVGYVLVCKTADPGADLTEPCVGRTMVWANGPATHSPSADNGSLAGSVQVYRDEQVKSDVVRVNHYADELVLSTELGYLLTGAVA